MWDFNILEMNSYSLKPDLVYFEAKMEQSGRGKFVLNGYGYTEIDATDDVVIQITCKKSSHRDGPYYPVLFGNMNDTLTNVMNRYYKPLLQPMLEKCCDNCPIIKNKYVPPLPKLHLKFNNCEINTDNLPNYMPTGYYKTRVTVVFPFEVYSEWIAYIENKVF